MIHAIRHSGQRMSIEGNAVCRLTNVLHPVIKYPTRSHDRILINVCTPQCNIWRPYMTKIFHMQQATLKYMIRISYIPIYELYFA